MNIGHRIIELTRDWISIKHGAIILITFLADKAHISYNGLK